jgi:septum formation topological specificity factor MinE
MKAKLKKSKPKKVTAVVAEAPTTRPIITVHKDDFVLITEPGLKKPVLAKVLKLKNDGIHGLLSYEKIALEGEAAFEFDCQFEDVVANLGPKPTYGKVFGCDIEPYHKLITTKLSSTRVAVMVGLSTREEEKLEASFSKFYKIAKKHGFLQHFKQIRIVVRPGMTSVAGMWSLAKDGSEKIDIYVPRSDAAEKGNTPVEYILAHEIGHHIWNRYFTEEEKAVWIAMHRKAVAVEDHNTAKVAHFRSQLVAAGSVKELKKTIEDEAEKKLFSEILSRVCKTFKIRPDELNALLKSGDNLSNYWINTAVQKSDSSVIITEYARKNSQELFSECLAHYLLGMEMPEKLEKKTANYLRKAVNRGPHGEMKAIKISG